MELPAEEQRQWRELAAELRHDRRLAALAVGFGTVIRWRRNIATARAGTAIPAVTWIPATAGGCLGLALVIAGALAGSSGLSIVGTAVLVTSLVLTGGALLAIGIAGCRNVGGHGDRE